VTKPSGPSTESEEATRKRELISTLRAAETTRSYPAELTLSEAFEEIELWLKNDRQWQDGRGKHWTSLLADVTSAITVAQDALKATGTDTTSLVKPARRVLRAAQPSRHST
jgi:hypothetical protein